jgi:hypothetical protein
VADTIEDLEKKLEASRAARVERQRADEGARKLRMLQEEMKLVEFEATEGILGKDIKAIFSPRDGSMVVVRVPKPVIFQRFQQKMLGQKGVTVVDLYDLVHGSLVYPDKATLEKICDATPGMLGLVSTAVVDLAGSSSDDLVGK